MGFRHVVMFRWADHVDAATAEQVVAELSKLPDAIPSIRSYVQGGDVGESEGNFDHVIVADFDDVEGWREYRDDATHQQLIVDLIKPNISARSAVQYVTPPAS